jgi:hypothetical protein
MGWGEKINPRSTWYRRHVLKIADSDSGYFASNGALTAPLKLHKFNLWRKFVLFLKRLFLWN